MAFFSPDINVYFEQGFNSNMSILNKTIGLVGIAIAVNEYVLLFRCKKELSHLQQAPQRLGENGGKCDISIWKLEQSVQRMGKMECYEKQFGGRCLDFF